MIMVKLGSYDTRIVNKRHIFPNFLEPAIYFLQLIKEDASKKGQTSIPDQ